MPMGIVFWLVLLIWGILSLVGFYRPAFSGGWFGHGLFAFILLFLLGWRVFGFPIQNQ